MSTSPCATLERVCRRSSIGTLFTPFVTTKAHGLGIGLTIARTIVDAHGGTIDARNNPEGGATFTVTLRRSETPRLLSGANRGAAMTIRAHSCPSDPACWLRKTTLTVAKAVCRVLSLDCEVVGTVADGGAVLEAAQRLQPDVIVLDLNLPNVNGLEACRQITQVNPQTKVIVFTAMNDPDLRQRCLRSRSIGFCVQDGGPRR